jgi:hypothetical protein
LQEKVAVRQLVDKLRDFDSVVKMLQTEVGITLAHVRKLFDGLSDLYPEVSPYLNSFATIVHSDDFELGCVGLLNGDVTKLTPAARTALTRFRKPAEEPDVEIVTAPGPPKDFAASLLGKRTLRAEDVDEGDEYEEEYEVPRVSMWYDVAWIPPTSCRVERLFSRTKLVRGLLRQSLSDETLEMLMILQWNEHLWSAADVSGIMDGTSDGEGEVVYESVRALDDASESEEDDENDLFNKVVGEEE